MQYTDNEAALIGGLISNYFFQPSVDAKLRESYRRVLRHLHENTLSASDLSRIQNALMFLSPLCRDTREAHKDMMGVTLKTDALLRVSRYLTGGLPLAVGDFVVVPVGNRNARRTFLFAARRMRRIRLRRRNLCFGNRSKRHLLRRKSRPSSQQRTKKLRLRCRPYQ